MGAAAPSSELRSLREAEAALKSGDEDIALEEIVRAWRSTRAPALAKVACSLSTRLEPHVARPSGNLATFQPVWVSMAKRGRAVDFPVLAATVLETTNRFGNAVVSALLERGEVLAAWPADPRAASIVAELLLRGGYESTSRSTLPFWSSLLSMLRANADPAAAELLKPIRFAKVFRSFSDGKRRIAWFQQQTDGLVAELEAAPAAPPLQKELDTRAQKIRIALKSLPKAGPNAAVRGRLGATIARPVEPPPKTRSRPRKAASGSASEHLRNVRSAADDESQLASLLAAWRVAPAPDLADLVEIASARVDATRVDVRAATRAASQALWLDIAARRDPADLPRLLASIAATFGRSTDALARVAALGAWDSDPRTLGYVLAQLEVPAFHSNSTRSFWKALIRLAVEHGDRRGADCMDELASRMDAILAHQYADRRQLASWFRRELGRAAATLRGLPPVELAKGDHAAVQAIRKRLGRADEDLLARIADQPDDDETKAVFADLLQARGDPRGEFIAMQLADEGEARVAELLLDHAAKWARPLAPFVNLPLCRFESGFLHHVEVAGLEPERLVSVVDHPIWGTVRTIHFGWVQARSFRRGKFMTSVVRVTRETDQGPRSLALPTMPA